MAEWLIAICTVIATGATVAGVWHQWLTVQKRRPSRSRKRTRKNTTRRTKKEASDPQTDTNETNHA